MKLKYTIVAVWGSLLLSSVLLAYDDEIQKFGELLLVGDNGAAVNLIVQSNKYIARGEGSGIEKLKSNLDENMRIMGRPVIFEKIFDGVANERLVHISYLPVYEGAVYRFDFDYFKIDDRYVIAKFALDDNVFDDLGRAARVEMAKFGPKNGTTDNSADSKD